MGNFVLRAASALFGVVVLAGLLGTGVASADYVGQTYGKAAEDISSKGYEAVIATVVGDQLATDDCVVTGSKVSRFLNSSGDRESKAFLLNLNCNAALAQPGTPGNSAATPAGRKVKTFQFQADKLSKNAHDALAAGKEPWCGMSETNADRCTKLCDTASITCSEELIEYLARL